MEDNNNQIPIDHPALHQYSDNNLTSSPESCNGTGKFYNRPLLQRSGCVRKYSCDSSLSSCSSKNESLQTCLSWAKTAFAISKSILLVVVSITVAYLVFLINPSGSRLNLCVPCSSLVIGDSMLDDYRLYFKQTGDDDEDNPKCCANTPEQFQLMIDALVQRGLRGPLMGAVTGSGGAVGTRSLVNMYAAQVFLGTACPPSNGYSTVAGWTTTPDVAFVRTGITYDAPHGTFNITRQGLYMVYSHMAFRRSPQSRRTQGFIYSHKIVRKNSITHTTEEDLIVDTEVRSCNEENFSGVPCYSSSIFTQLRLRQGDEIEVQTLNPDLLVADGRASYFGICMIS